MQELIRCPECGKAVSQGKDKVYETLCEHVLDPNSTDQIARPTWICTNPKCRTFNKGYWADIEFEGAWYSKERQGDEPIKNLLKTHIN